MPKLIDKLIRRLPLQFRVLYRQFLLRVIDLESLSIQADIPRFLGQFAGILIMYSAIQGLGLLMGFAIDERLRLLSTIWSVEQRLISTMMLVAGLIAVASWDNIFPDRRDAMILSPLPVRPRVVLIAKVAASAAVLGLAVVSLNFASGTALALILGGIPHFLRITAAYWFTMIAASVFLYGALLTVQGVTALLPRRLFLRLSAILQIAAFGILVSAYFLEPKLNTPAALAMATNHQALEWLPDYWFFALFNQLAVGLPPTFAWLAARAWIGFGASVIGAASSLLLCYLRTMRKTVEEPDLVPASRGLHLASHLGGGLRSAIVFFGFRSLARSRQHRLALAFYLSIVLAIALSWLRSNLSAAAPRSLDANIVIASFMMTVLAVFGLRNVFSLPVSLTANWVWRITQLRSTEKYVAAARSSLIFFAVVPVWLVSAALLLDFRPRLQVAAHLGVLALIGIALVEIALVGFHKVPFACSYLPGKTNVQFIFWGSIVVLATAAVLVGRAELHALSHPAEYGWIVASLLAVFVALLSFNRYRARSAALMFEELQPEVIMTLGLTRDGVSITELSAEAPARLSTTGSERLTFTDSK